MPWMNQETGEASPNVLGDGVVHEIQRIIDHVQATGSGDPRSGVRPGSLRHASEIACGDNLKRGPMRVNPINVTTRSVKSAGNLACAMPRTTLYLRWPGSGAER